MRKVKCAELILDFTLYPRTQVDSQHVGHIVQAMRAGVKMPPIVIDKASKRVTDGFHRVKAQLHKDGPDATIMVVEKTYKDEQAMFLDAIQYNAAHGRNLSTYDRSHCILEASRLGIDDKKIAVTLHVSEEYVGELRADRTATDTTSNLVVPIKRTIAHMKGRKLTAKQVAANKRLGGMQQLFYVNQIVTLLENDLLDTANEDLMVRLEHLAELLSDKLVKAVA